MKTRVLLFMAVLLAAGLALTGCGPDPEQQACERSGGHWESYIAGYTTTYVYSGKTPVPIMEPIIMFRCEGGKAGS